MSGRNRPVKDRLHPLFDARCSLWNVCPDGRQDLQNIRALDYINTLGTDVRKDVDLERLQPLRSMLLVSERFRVFTMDSARCGFKQWHIAFPHRRFPLFPLFGQRIATVARALLYLVTGSQY